MIESSWKPHKKQAEFLAIPYSVKEAFYGGGAGSAKTETLLNYGIIHRLHENPRFKQVFLRRTFPELRNEVVPRSKLIYRKLGAEFNATNMCWTFPSGAMIFLGHCETEDDVHQYDSMEINLFTPDELTSFSEWIYLYIGFERTRSPKGSGLPSIIRAAGMPGNIGHGWVKKRFVDPYPKGGRIINGRGNIKRIYIHATLADNPFVDPEYTKSLEALPEAEKQAKKYGSWDAYLGQVFEEFRDRKYKDEPENAIHVIDEFIIPDWWPKIIAMDWGFAPPAMTWIGYGAVSPEGRLYIYHEQHWQKTKIEEWCAQAKPLIEEANPQTIMLCKSGGQDRGQEHTIQQQISSALGRSVTLTSNTAGSRVSGKMLLHEYLRWQPKFVSQVVRAPYSQEHAEWILRNKTEKDYKIYVDSYSGNNEVEILPKLQIFKSCVKLIEAIKTCSYDKTNPQDVAEFPGDDPYDGIRYLVDRADLFINESQTGFKKVQERQNLVNQLEVSQDMTAFYRNARKLDSNNSVKGIRRYHG